MAIQLTVKEGNSERSWDVVDGQQIDINMAKGAEYALIDTRTGETPDGLRVVNNHGQTEIYGSDTFPWVTLHDDGSDTDAAPQPEAAPASPAATLGDNIAIADAAAAADASAPPPADAEHLQADEVAEPTNPNFEGTPSGGSMLLAGGGALLVGGLAAAIGGGSSGANPHYHEPDTSLAPHPLITYITSHKEPSALVRAMAGRGLAARVVLTSRNAEMIKNYVRQGLGIGVIADMAYDPERDSDLVMYPLDRWMPLFNTYLVWHGDLRLRAYHYDFIDRIVPGATRDAVENYVRHQQSINGGEQGWSI